MNNPSINIDELTVAQAKAICGVVNSMFGGSAASASPLNGPSSASDTGHPYKIGANYMVRTVTMINTGRLVQVTNQELVLEDAAWIADTGRFATTLKDGNFNEIEPFPDGRVIVGRGAVIDACELTGFPLPRAQK